MNGYPKQLRRSVANRWVGGVCGGLGEYLGIDPVAVRVVYALLSILPIGFPGFIMCVIYLVLWLIIPEREYY